MKCASHVFSLSPFPPRRHSRDHATTKNPLPNKSVAEVIDSVRLVGRETGFVDEGEAEARRLEEGFNKIRAVVAEMEARSSAEQSDTAEGSKHARSCKKKKVAFLEWLEPLFNGGHWIPDMVRAAGAEYTMAEPGEKEWTEVDNLWNSMSWLICHWCPRLAILRVS